MASKERIERVIKEHRAAFGAGPMVVVAPGRVNLIGEHTDYNDGFVLPMAMDLDVIIGVSKGNGAGIRLKSINFNQSHETATGALKKTDSAPWANYVMGVVDELQKAGIDLCGFDATVEGNVPLGSGLSSSAAIEVACAFALQCLVGYEMSGEDMSLLCQRAENRFVGVNCGIMDQFISRMGREGHALFLDCRDLSYKLAPISAPELRFMVIDSMVRRGLVDSAYNERRSQCERAAAAFNEIDPRVKALRDVSVEMFEAYRDRLDPIVARRSEHIVRENQRVLDAVDALESGGFGAFGELMIRSHQSLRDLYEVSCGELDALVDLCLGCEGVLGSRMTGAGFGGCTVTLARADALDDIIRTVTEKYFSQTGRRPSVFVSAPQAGAHRVE